MIFLFCLCQWNQGLISETFAITVTEGSNAFWHCYFVRN